MENNNTDLARSKNNTSLEIPTPFSKINYAYKYLYWPGTVRTLMWGSIYRRFLEGHKTKVKGQSSMSELHSVLTRKDNYVRDGKRELKDAQRSAESYQYWVDKWRDRELLEEIGHTFTEPVLPVSGMDCEDAAVYAYASGMRTPGKHLIICLLTVSWLIPWKWKIYKPGARCVCVFRDGDSLYHTGNWGLYPVGNYKYLSLEEIALDIWKHSSRYEDSVFYGFSTHYPKSLFPRKTNTRLFGKTKDIIDQERQGEINGS